MHLTKTKTLFTIVVALSVSPVFAGLHSWTSSGPAGGSITTMVADPANPATLYVGTHGAGIYKTEDNGRTWRAVNPGLPELVISTSSEVLPEFREYERFATTVLNAYVAPWCLSSAFAGP